jgi:hypothetical protein
MKTSLSESAVRGHMPRADAKETSIVCIVTNSLSKGCDSTEARGREAKHEYLDTHMMYPWEHVLLGIWIPANEDKKLSLSSTSPLNYKLIYSVLFSSPGRMAFAMASY